MKVAHRQSVDLVIHYERIGRRTAPADAKGRRRRHTGGWLHTSNVPRPLIRDLVPGGDVRPDRTPPETIVGSQLAMSQQGMENSAETTMNTHCRIFVARSPGPFVRRGAVTESTQYSGTIYETAKYPRPSTSNKTPPRWRNSAPGSAVIFDRRRYVGMPPQNRPNTVNQASRRVPDRFPPYAPRAFRKAWSRRRCLPKIP
ncbi:hypothetical protein FQR65_LT20739 [Abscondita terminalis]|nr:hypothetical protein FQR65_LT20739 [Abscondita terminalis]